MINDNRLCYFPSESVGCRTNTHFEQRSSLPSTCTRVGEANPPFFVPGLSSHNKILGCRDRSDDLGPTPRRGGWRPRRRRSGWGCEGSCHHQRRRHTGTGRWPGRTARQEGIGMRTASAWHIDWMTCKTGKHSHSASSPLQKQQRWDYV